MHLRKADMIARQNASLYKQGLMLLSVLMGLLSPCAHAHLLNMSKAYIQVQDDGQVTAEIKLDLAREFSGIENYYTISQSQDSLSDTQVQSMLGRLKQAVVLTVDDQSQSLKQQFNWHVDGILFPEMSKEDFISDISWPMTTIYLSTTLPETVNASAAMQIIFTDSFLFEEPIALTIEQRTAGGKTEEQAGRKMSRWLVPNQVSPSFALYPGASPALVDNEKALQWDTVKSYIWLGIKHIFPLGLDHVLFVLGLFLGIRNIKKLLAFITTFTLAHSFTLALSAYGAIQVSASIVEPLISISIMWIAIENIVFKQAQKWRFIVVFMFGLLHGLGFAAALRELGLPVNSFLTSLISFNVGIEIAQIAIVAFSFMLVGWLKNTAYWRTWIVIPSSSLIATIAFYWAVSRIVS